MPRDAAVGAVILALAGIYWLAARTIRHSSLEDTVGATGVPNTLAVLLAALALLLILRSFFLRPRPAGEPAGNTPGETPRAHWRALGMLVLGIAYLVVVPYLGYAVSVALLIAAVAIYNRQQPSLHLALIAVALAAGFYLVFVQFLGIPLPPGVWPALIPA